MTAAVQQGARRVLVAGGDGSIACAATVLAKSNAELAVAPAGTLNHFARDHGIPLDGPAALHLASTGTAVPVDVGYVNGQLFLNTSSVGAYVRFVKRRESLEKRLGYRLASALASLRTFASSRPIRLELDVEGRRHFYSTTLAFIGVGERELRIPTLGGQAKNGRSGLHVIIPRAGSQGRLLLIAASSALRGVQATVGALELDSFVVDRCSVELRHPQGDISLDGEIVSAATPLEYRIEREALRVVGQRVVANG